MILTRNRILLLTAVLFFVPKDDITFAQERKVEAAEYAIPATDDGLPGAGPIRRAGWFQNVWKNRRTTFASRRQSDQGAVVFLGDSITQGWRDDFRGAFPEMKTANVGISGDTTRGMLIRLQQDELTFENRMLREWIADMLY